MKLTQPFSALSRADVATAGGKGASLGEMAQAGIPVPPGFVVLTSAFERFLTEANLQEEIKVQLAAVNRHELETVERASEDIRARMLAADVPDEIKTAIHEAFTTLGAEYVAVRSSATAEDGAGASWAGELESYLNTTEETLLEKVKLCWSSLFTPRAIFYRLENGFSEVSVAVVVQKMVAAEVAGIAFSVHPVTEDPNQLIIEAGLGLGEAIVSGAVTPDNYVLDKRNFSVVDTYVSEQEQRLDRGGWTDISVDTQKLPDEKIQELARLVVSIETHYAFPCDIEWALQNGRIYILQSRPITTLQPKS